MKMKLGQKLFIGFYKTKLKTLGILSPRKAAETAYRIFCTPFAAKPPKKPPPVFHKAEKLSFKMDGLTIRGYRWNPDQPNGKKILIVHGFRSYAFKFEKYIVPLRRAGFEVLAFDAPAHGASDGKRINAYIYKNALLKIELLFGPIDGMMGHSLGALAAALAFEELAFREKRKLVLIAPATETIRAVDNFFSLISADTKTKEAFKNLIFELSDRPIEHFSVSRVVKSIAAPVLWVHDRDDSICSFEDVKPLLPLDLPHVRFLITEQLGHSKIYKDNRVCSEIVHFLSA
ncbi:MAG: hypothetical protein RLZZ28_2252 [Bacteroidota bacterium]